MKELEKKWTDDNLQSLLHQVNQHQSQWKIFCACFEFRNKQATCTGSVE